MANVATLKQDFPWLIGTSNYDLACRLILTPVGTQAHEWFQAFQQISPVLANNQCATLQAWLDEYDDQLGIALTDCIATLVSVSGLIFGIGTRLTCDIPGVMPLNIVIKLVQCNGKPVAKLSDSLGKTICQDKAFVRALCKTFDLPLVKKRVNPPLIGTLMRPASAVINLPFRRNFACFLRTCK